MRPFDRDKICLNTKNNCPLNSDISSSYNYRVLEIGTGTGMHPLSYAQKFPDRLIIAIEKTHERYGKFIRAYEKTKPMNLIPVHSHAVSWVPIISAQRNLMKYLSYIQTLTLKFLILINGGMRCHFLDI